MQSKAAAEADPTFEVTPPIRLTAPWRVASVAALPGARLRVTFIDGTEGEVDMSGFLEDATLGGTVFAPLRDPAMFAGVSVVMGAVQWPNGADLAPDAMYEEIKANGRWVLE